MIQSRPIFPFTHTWCAYIYSQTLPLLLENFRKFGNFRGKCKFGNFRGKLRGTDIFLQFHSWKGREKDEADIDPTERYVPDREKKKENGKRRKREEKRREEEKRSGRDGRAWTYYWRRDRQRLSFEVGLRRSCSISIQRPKTRLRANIVWPSIKGHLYIDNGSFWGVKWRRVLVFFQSVQRIESCSCVHTVCFLCEWVRLNTVLVS